MAGGKPVESCVVMMLLADIRQEGAAQAPLYIDKFFENLEVEMNLALMILYGQQPQLIIVLLIISAVFVGVLTVLEVRYRRAKKREEIEERQKSKKYPPFD